MHSKNLEIKIYTSAHNWVIFSKLEGGRCWNVEEVDIKTLDIKH